MAGNNNDDKLFKDVHHYVAPGTFDIDPLGGNTIFRDEVMGMPRARGGGKKQGRFNHLLEPNHGESAGGAARRKYFKETLARVLQSMTEDQSETFANFETYQKSTYLLGEADLPYKALGASRIRNPKIVQDEPAYFYVASAIKMVREYGRERNRYPKPTFLRSAFFDIFKNDDVCLRIELNYYSYLLKSLKDEPELRGKFPQPEDIDTPDEGAGRDPSEEGRSAFEHSGHAKLQTSFRLDPALRALLHEHTDNRSAWIENAIFEQLVREGADTSAKSLKRAFEESKEQVSHSPRRLERTRRKRTALPDPKKSANAHVNQNGEQVGLRLEPELLEQIEQARREEGISRVVWMERAIQVALKNGSAALPPYSPSEKATKTIMPRFADRLVKQVDKAATDINVTRSDWLRRAFSVQLQRPSASYQAEPEPPQ